MEMPDLPPEQKREEERKALRFWIEHCHTLEEKLSQAREEVSQLQSLLKTYMTEVEK